MSEQAKAHKAACVAANGGVKGAWTEEEKTLLRQTYPNPDYTTEDIAQMLGRTVMALHHPDAMPFCNTACPLIKRSRQNSQQKVSAT
jgi:hypothetical protein